MNNWVFIPTVFVLVLFSNLYSEQKGYHRGMSDTATALEPHLCKETR